MDQHSVDKEIWPLFRLLGNYGMNSVTVWKAVCPKSWEVAVRVWHTHLRSQRVFVCVCVCVSDLNPSDSGAYWRGCEKTRCWCCVVFFFFGKSREKKKKGANQRKGSGCFASNRRVKVNDYANQPQWLKLALCVGIHYRGKHHWFNNIYILHKSWWLITADGRVPTVH